MKKSVKTVIRVARISDIEETKKMTLKVIKNEDGTLSYLLHTGWTNNGEKLSLRNLGIRYELPFDADLYTYDELSIEILTAINSGIYTFKRFNKPTK